MDLAPADARHRRAYQSPGVRPGLRWPAGRRGLCHCRPVRRPARPRQAPCPLLSMGL
uniref:Uncharacterized protein n=1 Tax=uncultured marine virus TaxID=186617 RepID=A0A0F7L6L2_9VIRU|nr:hypothetical protein [uncultured marine virus]